MINEAELYQIVSDFARSGANSEKLNYVLKHLWNGNGPLSCEIAQKIANVINGIDTRERNIAREVKEFVNLQESTFNLQDTYKYLQLPTKREKDTAWVAVRRLCKEGLIEPTGNKSGTYRKINCDWFEMDWLNADTEELFIKFPLRIEDFARIYRKSIIILEGCPNSGKTSFCLEFARLNRNRFKAKPRYINSEMGETELKNRLLLYPQDKYFSLQTWKDIEFIERNHDYQDLINGDEKLFIIDYLEQYEEPWKIPQMINAIHERLDKGICLITLQRNPEKSHAWGGQATRHKARLSISLERGKATLQKVKSFRSEHSPDGLKREFKLVSGWKFIPQGDWIHEK
jgi:hypothetical protein